MFQKNDFLTSVGIDVEIVIIFGNESNATVSQNEIVIFQRNYLKNNNQIWFWPWESRCKILEGDVP